ncbi:MAG: chemotaxis protein CheX [bacterium]|nr:chemotaxis protein CheX [bacterium]
MEILERHHSIILDSVIKTFDIQADLRLERTHESPSNTPGPDALAISLAIEGGLHGYIAIALNQDAAGHIARLVLSKAMEREFDSAEIDADLRANTVGELLNFIIGDIVVQMRNSASSMIKVPQIKKYADLIDEATSRTKSITLAGPEAALRILYAFELTES